MKKTTILFIGAGRMAEAIFSGLLRKSDNPFNIIVSNQSNKEKLIKIKETYSIEVTQNWKAFAKEADIILLAIPPSEHKALLKELTSFIHNQCIVTVAAGIGPTTLENYLPQGTAAAWIMPNTAADLGESMSLYTCGKFVTADHKEMLKVILASIGEYEECTEQQIHDLTAIIGSAPAFLYYFTEILQQTAMQYNISEELAKRLVSQMVYGSAAMLKDGRDAKNLREQVTSPGGATEAGLNVLETHDFEITLMKAIHAVNQKALPLKK
jgi:pyrroline-5-carboxylate reductase